MCWFSSSFFLLFSLCLFFQGTEKFLGNLVEQEIEITIQRDYEIVQHWLPLRLTLNETKPISCFHVSTP